MKTYTVKSGDSLSLIARDFLGDMSLWPTLALINGIGSPYLIYPGQVLNLDITASGTQSESSKDGIKAPMDDDKKKILIAVAVVITVIVIVLVFYSKKQTK